MIQEILQQPFLLRIWIFVLIGANFSSLMFIQHSTGRWAVVFNISNLFFMSYLYRNYGYTRILGLSHVVCWTPLVLLLWKEAQVVSAESIYGFWCRMLLLINAVSLVVDYLDVFRFFFEHEKS